MTNPVIPEAAVEAVARVIVRTVVERSWGSLLPSRQEWYRTQARAALEAAAPHMLVAKVAEAKSSNDHIVEGGNGYSAGFHYALHCIAGDSE